MAMTSRFSNSAFQGSIQLIGNTLGLSKDLDVLAPGTYTSIGTFMTTLPSSQEPGWPPYTTSIPSQAYSMAELNLPLPNTIVYAELIWSATRSVTGGSVSVTQNGTLIGPDNLERTLTRNVINVGSQAISDSGDTATSYIYSADVTTIVQALGNGVYTFGSIPATMSPLSNGAQYAGWGLYVVYESPTERVKAVNLFTGTNVTVDGPYGVTVNYPGPPAELYIHALGFGGDVDQQDCFFDRNFGSCANGPWIEGPNNPSNNFYCSQINYPGDTINTFGPHGTTNHIAPLSTPVSGGRQGTDVSTVSMDNIITGPANTLVMDLGGSQDNIVIVGSGYSSDVSQPIMRLEKSSDVSEVSVGSNVIFQTAILNSIADANTVIFTDTLPPELSFNPGTVTIDGVTAPSEDPTVGISLGNILTDEIRTITFSATVNGITGDLKLFNISNISYGFTVNTDGFTGMEDSNEVELDYLLEAANKSVDKDFAELDETILYTVVISNFNVTSFTSVNFLDTLPEGIEFIADSLYFNGSQLVGEDPTVGVTLADIGPNTTNTLTFEVMVNSIPAEDMVYNVGNFDYVIGTLPNTLSTNGVLTTISSAKIITNKSVNLDFVDLGSTITYAIVLENLGNKTADNIVFIDTIPQGTSFISNSFVEDGVSISGSPNPPGISLNSIPASGVKTIEFSVLVESVPVGGSINNSGTVQYDFAFTDTITNSKEEVTNEVTSVVNNVDFSSIIKNVDLNFATIGQTINYLITIPNTGTTIANNVIFYDTIPSGTTLIPSSVLVGGVSTGENPETGINLNSLDAGEVITVFFSVLID